MDLRDLMAELIADLSDADRVLWIGWALDHPSLVLSTADRWALLERRETLMAGLLEPGPTAGDTIH